MFSRFKSKFHQYPTSIILYYNYHIHNTGRDASPIISMHTSILELCHLFLDTSRIWDNPRIGQIRLTGGNYSNQGVLEVYCNGQWGTVCDNGFGTTDARVACRQLGYSTYLDYDHLSL